MSAFRQTISTGFTNLDEAWQSFMAAFPPDAIPAQIESLMAQCFDFGALTAAVLIRDMNRQPGISMGDALHMLDADIVSRISRP